MLPHYNKHFSKAFTLIELIAVIVVLSLVLIILIPNITRYSDNSKVSLRDSKIKSIVTAAEEYGNDSINKYQHCLGTLSSEELEEKECTFPINKLVTGGYLEGEDESNQIFDPVSNQALNGKILLCFDPVNVNVYGSYVEDDVYSCKVVDVNSSNTLNLSSIVGTMYVGGDDVEVNIIKNGEFDVTCSSSKIDYATCSIRDNVLVIKSPGIMFSDEEYKNVTISIKEVGGPLIKNYSLKVYPTSIKIVDNNVACMKSRDSIELELQEENTGVLTTSSSDVDILEGISNSGILSINAKDKTGEAVITVSESHGKKSASISKKVYKLSVEPKDIDFNGNLLLGQSEEITINHDGTGTITVASSNPSAVKFYTPSNTTPRDSVTLNSDTKIIAVGIGTGESDITIQGSTCGLITQKFSVANLNLSETSGTIYIGSDSTKEVEIIADDTSELTCESSNERAATCVIHAGYLSITPGTEPNDNVIIKVKNKAGGFITYNLRVIATTLEIVDSNGLPVNNVCSNANSEEPNPSLFVRGSNIGNTSIYEIEDWFLADANVASTGDIRRIDTSKQNLNAASVQAPYRGGYNTGRTQIKIKESNGNKIASFYHDTYSMTASKTSASIKVDEYVDFDVIASGTGEVSVSSSNRDIATARVISSGSYNGAVNANNTRTIRVTGNSTGTATITVKGEYCGTLTFNIKVTGKVFTLNLLKGTYTTGLEKDTISCTTTGNFRSCKVTFPNIYTTEEFKVIGYSTIKDSKNPMYKPGDEIELNALNTNKTYYGNSVDINIPVCTISTPEFIKKNETAYFDLSCTDSGGGIKGDGKISSSSFTISNSSIAEITSVSEPTEISQGYSYKIGIKGKSAGLFNITFKENILIDTSDNGNTAVTSDNLLVSEYEYVKKWYVGKNVTKNVIAVLYDNSVIDSSLPENTYSLRFYGTGDMKDYSSNINTSLPWYDYRPQITEAVIAGNVTNIGSRALHSASNLDKVSISNEVTYIGEYAFYNTNISSIVIPNSVTTIKDYAFYQNRNLSGITLGNSITSIGASAFEGNIATSIKIPSNVISIGDYAFKNDSDRQHLTSLTFLGTKIKTIGIEAFKNNMIESLNIPSSIETIKDGAFAQTEAQSKLKNLTFGNPSSLKTIGKEAFINCNLSSLSLPPNLTSIGDRAFSGNNSGLTSLSIGKDVSSLGESFIYGIDLKSFLVDNQNIHFTTESEILYNKSKSMIVRIPPALDLSSFAIPNSVSTIGAYAGYGNRGILTITIPDSVNSIGNYAFYSDVDYAFKTIYLNSNDSVNFNDTSFALTTYSGSSLVGKERIIKVKTANLKSRLDNMYKDKEYTITVEVT